MLSILNTLQFNNLYDISSLPTNEQLYELKEIGIEKVHFSGKYPAVFFKEVQCFDSDTLKEIAHIHHKLWNYKKVLFLYVTTTTEIRIYNCYTNPFNYKKSKDIEEELNNREIARSTINHLNDLINIFSASAIDSGMIWNIKNDYRKKISLTKRLDKFLVTSLITTRDMLVNMGLEPQIVHSLIMRSLFIMYLEDKGATLPEYYAEKIEDGCTSYLDVLDNKQATYKLFQLIQDKFNGNVFPVGEYEKTAIKQKHLNIIKKCLTNGDLKNENLFDNWRIFDFNIIPIEVLSQIYERLLDKTEQKKSGSFYTPLELVDLILNDLIPVEKETNYQIKILDPSCGSGIFLVEAYKRLISRWHNAHPNKSIDFKTLKSILKNTIYGIEISQRSIRVATFSLYLCMLDHLNPKTIWHQGKEKFPYLINDSDDKSLAIQGFNLFRSDAIEDNIYISKHQYDIVVGNPPFGESFPNNIKLYCQKNKFSQEFAIPFIHKSVQFSRNGKIALIVPTKILTKRTIPAQNFRHWLFNLNYVKKVYNLSILRNSKSNYGGQLFSSATVPVSIIFFQNKIPSNPTRTIEYWAPKTYIKNHVIEGVILDSSDVKFLPRKECHKRNTKIWKIAQWGSLNDFNLLKKFSNNISFKEFTEKNNIVNGVGFQLLSPKARKTVIDTELSTLPYLKASSIQRLYTPNTNTPINDALKESRKDTQNFYLELYNSKTLNKLPPLSKFRMTAKDKNIFKAPHFVLKKGLIEGSKICTSYIDYNCSFRDGVYGFYSKNKDNKVLKYLTILFSSNYTHYFLFMTSSSYAVEREQIMLDEYLDMPMPKVTNEQQKFLASLIEEKITNVNYFFDDINSSYINFINSEVSKTIKLSEDEEILIDDAVSFTIDLFHKGDKSIALKPLKQNSPETIAYSKKLHSILNTILVDSNLNLTISIYKVTQFNPLSIVRLKFEENNFSKTDINIIDSTDEFNKILSTLNEYTFSQYSQGIYVRKHLIYYTNDMIYIVKPNQKRFWLRSQAIEDAQKILLEIMDA